MTELLNNDLTLHWLRPEWLWAIIPAIIISALLWRSAGKGGSWSSVISPELLPYLIDGAEQRKSRYPIIALLIIWVLAAIAMAGPAVTKIPVPVYQKQDAIIILLDLSPSMLAEDSAPSRMVQAQREVLDLLDTRNEGLTALIAYSGDAFTVSPLTTDTETIALLARSLAPATMPSIGNNPIAAIELADRLRKGGSINEVKLVWITDNLPEEDASDIAQLLNQPQFTTTIIGIGSKDGAPIPLAKGGFLRDNNNAMVIPKLNEAALNRLANEVNGLYLASSVDDGDTNRVIEFSPATAIADSETIESLQFDEWRDEAPWLVLVLLPFIAAGFRKGWLLSIGLVLLLPSEQSYAFSWNDLWQTKDQQAQQAYNDGDYGKAADLFEDKTWQGIAEYKNDKAGEAVENFNGSAATDHYNRGNALAKSGKIKEAIEAYKKALELDPEFEDAQFNKELLESLPKEPPQSENSDSNQKSDDGDNSDQEQNESDSESDQNQQSDQNNSDDNQSDGNQSDEQNDQASQNNESENSDNQNEQDPQQGDESEQENDQQQNGEQDNQTEENAEQENEGSQSPQEQNGETEEQQAQAGDIEEGQLSDEEQQALDQQLRLLNDDPGELLRRKFQYQYQQRGNASNQGEQRW